MLSSNPGPYNDHNSKLTRFVVIIMFFAVAHEARCASERGRKKQPPLPG